MKLRIILMGLVGLLLIACGPGTPGAGVPNNGGGGTPVQPAPNLPQGDVLPVVTFWVMAYINGDQEYVQNVGLTLIALDKNFTPLVHIKNKDTGVETLGTQSNPSAHTTTFWEADPEDPGVAFVELAISAIMPKGAYLVCEVHNAHAGSPPTRDPQNVIKRYDSEKSAPSGVMSVATVNLSCLYPAL